MCEEDVQPVLRLMQAHLNIYKFSISLSPEDVRHWLLPREGLVYSYVNVGERVTDFFSFYSLSTKALSIPSRAINTAYLFYYASDSGEAAALIKRAIHVANCFDFDVFNCLNIMQNESFIHELRFEQGDGILRYYLFNWRTAPMHPRELGLVML